MILEFKFRNFRSAKDWQILSFEASADKVSEEYYCTTINDTKVLKLGILYGANASGKTNVLLALDFIRKTRCNLSGLLRFSWMIRQRKNVEYLN